MKSKAQNFQFISWSELGYQQFLSKRDGEIRLGERFVNAEQARFVVLGIEESIGPKANLGNSGAENGFKAFCSRFLNMQSTTTLLGDSVGFLGSVQTSGEAISELYAVVNELDDFVCEVLSRFVSSEQVLIVVGGGHNNALPIIQSRFNTLNARLNVINLDAHADYRSLEGRHSGNPFSYAVDQGLIEKYFVLGLHQRYNNEDSLQRLQKDNQHFTFFEDYIDCKSCFEQDVRDVGAALLTTHLPFGVELDMDSIENMPSSAVSPSGFSMTEARYYIRQMARINQCYYLHLPEAAPKNEKEAGLVGKALSYLVTDFISCHPFSNLERLSE